MIYHSEYQSSGPAVTGNNQFQVKSQHADYMAAKAIEGKLFKSAYHDL